MFFTRCRHSSLPARVSGLAAALPAPWAAPPADLRSLSSDTLALLQPPGAASRLPEDLTPGPVCSQDAKSDLVNVLSSLEAHWHVLEAEVVEINRDIDYCEQCLRKYGEWFNSPLQYLRELKRSKKNKMKEIIRTMESFNNNLQGGKRLVKSLEKQAVSSTGHLPLPSDPTSLTACRLLCAAACERPAGARDPGRHRRERRGRRACPARRLVHEPRRAHHSAGGVMNRRRGSQPEGEGPSQQGCAPGERLRQGPIASCAPALSRIVTVIGLDRSVDP